MTEESSSKHEATSSSNSFQGEINSNLRLCSVLLNEFNYLPWSRAISLALGGRSKLGYINGSIGPPERSSTSYGAWHASDQLVMSWILNSMEPKLSELFSYSESSFSLWESIKEMYGSQNNAARIFQLKKDIAGLKQGDRSFVQHLGSIKSMWNELDMYRPHSTDSAVLLKRADEDKVFQLLASLGAEYEDLRSHLLMTPELPSFNGVCQAVQREETRRKVMHIESKSNPEARVFSSYHKHTGENFLASKKADWKCTHCNMKGHLRDKCWILHPELKPKFDKEGRMIKEGKRINPKALHSSSSSTGGISNFTENPIDLINEFANFLQRRGGNTQIEEATTSTPTAMLGKFAGFLAETSTHDNVSGLTIMAMSATIVSTETIVLPAAAAETQPQQTTTKLVSPIEIEFVQCDCCGLTEECTPAYIEHVRERYQGHWICGLCAEAIKDEIVRSQKRLISTEEALATHMNFCKKFKDSGPPPNPTIHLISAMRQILRRSLDSPRGGLRSTPSSPTKINAGKGLTRSESCFPTLTG